MCVSVWTCFQIDSNSGHVPLLIFFEMMTVDRGDMARGDTGATLSGCTSVCECCASHFDARARVHVRSLENFPDEQRPSLFCFFGGFFVFFPQPNLQHKGNEGDTYTLYAHTQRLHLLHTSLTLSKVISQTNTCYVTLWCAHTHAYTLQSQWQAHKHTRLCFPTKACFCSFVMISQKTSLAEREVLTGIWLVIGEQKP